MVGRRLLIIGCLIITTSSLAACDGAAKSVNSIESIESIESAATGVVTTEESGEALQTGTTQETVTDEVMLVKEAEKAPSVKITEE